MGRRGRRVRYLDYSKDTVERLRKLAPSGLNPSSVSDEGEGTDGESMHELRAGDEIAPEDVGEEDIIRKVRADPGTPILSRRTDDSHHAVVAAQKACEGDPRLREWVERVELAVVKNPDGSTAEVPLIVCKPSQEIGHSSNPAFPVFRDGSKDPFTN